MAPTSKAFVTVLLLCLALCQITAAESSLKDDKFAKRIVRAIKQITVLSDNLRKETETIIEDNADVWGIIIPRGFDGINTQVAEATKVISSTTHTLRDDDAKRVVETLTTLVQVQQKLLHVVIEKHEIPSLFPYFEPIRLSLVQLESEVKSFESALLKVIPTQEPAAETQFDRLRDKIEKAINIYEGKRLLTSHGDSPVEDIQEALTTFLQAQQELLNVLNGKHGITTYAGDLA